MNIASNVYRQAQARGLTLEADGADLVVKPRSKCPPEFADLLRQHKAQLLHWLSQGSCSAKQAVPPDNLPLNPVCAHLSQADARSVMHYIADQIDGNDFLCDWCLKRELAYWSSYHWPDQILAYAAARDAACWQLKRTETEVWRFSTGFGTVDLALINPTGGENPKP